MMEQGILFVMEPEQPARASISLKEFNARIAAAVNGDKSLQGVWVVAETSDVAVRRNGHCYLELLEKSDDGTIVARTNAMIWANAYKSITARFEQQTGIKFDTGLKVLARVSANYHESYGIKVVIHEIDPSFTEGDVLRRRREIRERLIKEGTFDNNRKVAVPPVVQRVAVISSASAAGYGDFMNQLANNPAGVRFYTCLFPAVMQGVSARESIVAAMRAVYVARQHFDCLVMIRGGGSSSDLNCFDDYDIARAITLFPLPVVVGIGHERDTTILDEVAGVRVKTPTAAAEWLIARAGEFVTRLTSLTTLLQSVVSARVAGAREQLTYYETTTVGAARALLSTSRVRLDALASAIPPAARSRITAERTRLDTVAALMAVTVRQRLGVERLALDGLAQRLTILSPRNTINRGFAVARHNKRYVTTVSDVQRGDRLDVHVTDGVITTIVQ